MKPHPHIEDAYVLCIADLLAAHASGAWSVPLRRPPLPWPAGGVEQEAIFKLNFEGARGKVELTYAAGMPGQLEPASDSIVLEATRPHYGGARWWFLCGVTGKRASKLYLFPPQRRFCHRTGFDLKPTYLSQRVSGLDKVCRRLWVLRRSLPCQGSILEPLKRPPRMHLKTYARLLQRDAEIRSSLGNKLPDLLRELGIPDLEGGGNSQII